jgi:uncharacterized membrane protein
MTAQDVVTPEARRRAPRWVLALLIASVALNLIIVGSVAAAMWRFRTPPVWAGSVTPNLLGYASTLPPERRKDLWERTRDQRQQVRPVRRELRAARDDMVAALTAEPFDRQRVLEAQTRLLEADRRARVAVYALYAEIAQGMTPEERHAFREWREYRRSLRRNLLDEPDHQVKQPHKQIR